MADQIGGASGNATSDEVLLDATFSNVNGPQTGTMPNIGGASLTPSGTGTVAIPAGYHDGTGVVEQVAVPAADVLAGTDIAGVAGSMPNNGSLTYGPSTASQSIPAGYTSGGTINPVTGSATPGSVLSNETFDSSSGVGQTGTMPNQGSPTLLPGQSIPAGYYSGGSAATVQATSSSVTSSSGTASFTLYGGAAKSFNYLQVPVPTGAHGIISVVALHDSGAVAGTGTINEIVVATPFGSLDAVSTILASMRFVSAGNSYDFIDGGSLSLSASGITIPCEWGGSAYSVTVIWY